MEGESTPRAWGRMEIWRGRRGVKIKMEAKTNNDLGIGEGRIARRDPFLQSWKV